MHLRDTFNTDINIDVDVKGDFFGFATVLSVVLGTCYIAKLISTSGDRIEEEVED